MATPVVLVHGWGGSFEHTWRRTGFSALLADAGRTVIGVDLLGHGTAPRPHEPGAYLDLGARVLDHLPDEPVDAVGFSLGAIVLLRLVAAQPHRFRRIVVAGVGRNVLEAADEAVQRRIIAGVEGTAEPDDAVAQLFGRYARSNDNDPAALAALLRRPSSEPMTPQQLGGITCPVLVVIGDRDFAGPADTLLAALQSGRLVTLRNTDHFATTESFGFVDAALEFLDAIPT